MCDLLSPVILTFIGQPLNPNVAVDNGSHFSFLSAHACTCMGLTFTILSVKVTFKRMWTSHTADKVNIRQ